jgi:hypothetical protein
MIEVPQPTESKKPANVRKQRRQQASAKRQEARARRTLEEQLALLDDRPGNSTKERARIEAAIRERDDAATRRRQAAISKNNKNPEVPNA